MHSDISFQPQLLCGCQSSLVTFKPSLTELIHCWLSWLLPGKSSSFCGIAELFMATDFREQTTWKLTYKTIYIHFVWPYVYTSDLTLFFSILRTISTKLISQQIRCFLFVILLLVTCIAESNRKPCSVWAWHDRLKCFFFVRLYVRVVCVCVFIRL